MRSVAAQSIVLLKNKGGLLPLKPQVSLSALDRSSSRSSDAAQEQGLKKISIIGGNAKATVISGGGSAALKPSFFVSPYDGIVNLLSKQYKDLEFTYSEGARGSAAFHLTKF